VAIPVSDDDMRRAQLALLRHGLFAEPAGAASTAALAALRESTVEFNPQKSKVVVLMTGGGLRTLASDDIHAAPFVEPTADALERAIRG
jgi:threonine synthase